ncbi:metalloproteinase [Bacteroides thetaiotaomicron]|uniref:plasmid mobilization protein n=1 Tax=Bacteroides thetaiotaomicron TaxID=818 RepID=UPI0018CB7E36|nr:metalloproteinase [Bacteroides thetaiotaomicron]MBG9235588.1 metalloproteinase [Bacteroides thetaiotaomicron]MBG9240717.1 metalloproteinase [Bacteroides thetaiotaomicron]
MKEDIENSSTTSGETRSVFIGAKVTPRQKEYIKSQAAQCGMTVSDYLLARAYNYHPKARLTKEEAALLQNLDNCRSDLVKYTSALHGMSTKQRVAMFNQIPFMVGWLKELGNVAESVCQFLNAAKEQNKIPSNDKSEEI